MNAYNRLGISWTAAHEQYTHKSGKLGPLLARLDIDSLKKT